MFRLQFVSNLRWLTLVALLASGVVNAAGQWPELEALLEREAYVDAWPLAQELAIEHAGDPEFDLLYALTALEARSPQHAVFALERVLLARPDHHRARVELARAYFMLGDHAAARREFQAVQSIGPPPNVRSRVDAFLAEIERRESDTRTQVTGFVELRPGWDSNVNSATADADVMLGGVPVTLLDSARETGDRFLDKNAGLTVVHPLSKRRALFADLAYRDRENFDTQDFDTRSVGISAGWTQTDGRDSWRLPLQYQVLYLGNQEFRRLFSIAAEWSRDLSARNQILAFGQLGGIRYPGQSSRDVDLIVAGGGWTHRYAGAPMLASMSAYLGDESARETAGDHNGRWYAGLRLGAQWTGLPRHTPYASLTLQRSEYDADNPVFLAEREEDFLELRLGWAWQMRPQLTLTAEASSIRNEANIGLYEYDRHQFAVGLRYRFE